MTQKITLELSEPEIKFLRQYARVYEGERKFDITHNPIVTVQKRRTRVTAPGYHNHYEYHHGVPGDSGFEDLKSMIDDFILTHELELSESERLEFMADLHCEFYFYPNERVKWRGYDFYRFTMQYYWEDVAYFLTRKEADRYREYQAHNLGVSRTFSMGTGYKNCGDLVETLPVLRKIGTILNQEETEDI